MKTLGQRLYEAENPTHVTLYASRTPWAEAVVAPNPRHVPAWELLTERCRAGYEARAQGHWRFSGKSPSTSDELFADALEQVRPVASCRNNPPRR